MDPGLGWGRELERAPGTCGGSVSGEDAYCRAVHQRLLLYSALQEQPLEASGADAAIRGVYNDSLGVAIAVRAVRVKGQAFLVAKVHERDRGPLGWIATRKLSTAEWASLARRASRLPDGRHAYFQRPEGTARPRSLEATKGPPAFMCAHLDGISVRIERFQNGVLHVLDGSYRRPGPGLCSGPCCDPQAELRSEVVSRFFDRLAGLVECAGWPRRK